jgi:hypothetical protein
MAFPRIDLDDRRGRAGPGKGPKKPSKEVLLKIAEAKAKDGGGQAANSKVVSRMVGRKGAEGGGGGRGGGHVAVVGLVGSVESSTPSPCLRSTLKPHFTMNSISFPLPTFQDTWKAAALRASGEKVLDDPKLLRKSLKKEQKRKEKSGKQWQDRIQAQKDQKDQQQTK